MRLCSRCGKNVAVMFITGLQGSPTKSEGLCLPCAKAMGIISYEQLADQVGLSKEQLSALENEMNSLFKELESFAQQEDVHNINSVDDDDDDDDDDGGFMDFFSGFAFPHVGGNNSKTKHKKSIPKKRILDKFGINLTKKAQENKIDVVIGRDKEIERCIVVLNRRQKNNPCLIGEPGVGKTAIAEGLAKKIVDKQVPSKLLNHQVYSLDFTAIVAGTHYRGQFENRLKAIIDEAVSLGNIIFVIDEVHSIVGAGDAEGAMNAANILKPALARGDILVIGATTINEYRKHIEKDQALERRFQPIMIEEPSVEQTVEILKGIKNYYESFHKVKITEPVLRAAATLSERYITDRFLPDKAIDVIDEAGSSANLANRALTLLESLKSELRRVQEQKETAVSSDSIEEYQKAADLKMHECRLIERISGIEKSMSDVYLTVEDVAKIIEGITKIPVAMITAQEQDRLMNLEKQLEKRVVSQNEAIEQVANAIRRNRCGFTQKARPASFIFVGPSGVGKTELVKALAQALFSTEEALIRLDMSEYMEKHTASKIIGAPPGYVGYEETGVLCEQVRRRPYSVILLDEIEKAHPDVFNLLLQVLDDGRIQDNHGRIISFENTVIIMTSNAGTDRKSGSLGFAMAGNSDSKEQKALRDIFRPEFLNRVDRIITFNRLDAQAMELILDRMLEEFVDAAAQKDLKVHIPDQVRQFILEQALKQNDGARPLRRLIQSHLEDQAARLLLNGETDMSQTHHLTVRMKGDDSYD